MNIKDFKWTEKRFGTRFATILSNLSLSDNSNKEVPLSGDLKDLVDVKPYTKSINRSIEQPAYFTLLTQAYDEPDDDVATSSAQLKVDDATTFDVGDTILVVGVYGYEPGTTTQQDKYLMLKVEEIEDDATIVVTALNGKAIDDVDSVVPSISRGCVLLKLGARKNNNPGSVKTEGSTNIIINDNSFELFSRKFPITTGLDVNKEFDFLKAVTYLYGVKGYKGFDGVWWAAGSEFGYDPADIEFGSETGGEVFMKNMVLEYCSGAEDNITTLYFICGNNLYFELLGWINTPIFTIGNITVYLIKSKAIDFHDANGGIVFDPTAITIYVKTPKTKTIENNNIVITEESTIVLSKPKNVMRILAF